MEAMKHDRKEDYEVFLRSRAYVWFGELPAVFRSLVGCQSGAIGAIMGQSGRVQARMPMDLLFIIVYSDKE